jgi:hypothetical protein
VRSETLSRGVLHVSIEYPVTFYFAGVTVIVLAWLLITAGTRGRVDPVRLNVNRLSEGVAGLAVVAYVLHRAAHDLRGGFAELLAFFTKLPVVYAILPLPVLLSVGCLLLLTGVSALRFVVGLQGPFPLMQKTMMIAKELGWFAAGAGLWLAGVFVPASWDWGYFGRGLNLALTTLYLFLVTSSAVAIAVLLLGGGNPLKRYERERNAPMRPVQPSQSGSGWAGLFADPKPGSKRALV